MSDDITKEPRYDVAISFLSANEALALRISDGLTDRLTTFVYSREQPEVVGRNTDGVEAFTNTFRHDSRVCVVLHTDGWGKKGYTHIEEAAMKERAYEHGWDFLIVVCLDEAKPPKWIPPTKVWYGFKRYGFEGLLATIDLRVTELGGRPKQDSVLEKAARLARQRDFEQRQQLFGHSVHGFKAAREEVARMEQLLESRVQQLAAVSPDLDLSFSKSQVTYRSFAAISPGASFVLYWQTQYGNSLTDAALFIVEWGGRFSYAGNLGGPPKLDSFAVTPTIDYANRVVWKLETTEAPLRSEQLIDYLFARLLDYVSPKAERRSTGGLLTEQGDEMARLRREQRRELQQIIDNDWRF